MHSDSASDAAPAASAPLPTSSERKVHRLKPNAVGLAGVLFMAVATSAPITAMVGNVPLAVGFGNGAGAPAGFIVATVILGLFGIGYAAMAKHITATGAFYGYISNGTGRGVGLVAGLLTCLAYLVFEAAVVGIFATFARDLASSLFGVDVPWVVFALVMLAGNAALTYFDVNLAAKLLGVMLLLEIAMLLVTALSVLFTGGGPEGWSFSSLNPLSGLTNLNMTTVDGAGASTALIVGSAGIGLFFAFSSWVGFESSAMYGEESKDPKRIIPIAIVTSVVGIGVFYTFVSWMAIVGTGPTKAVLLAQDSATASEIFLGPARTNLGEWAVQLFLILLCTGSYACGMAFHNCAARYFYAISREDLVPGLARTLGRTHHRHGSPHIAGFFQTVIATAIVLFFAATDRDPYGSLYALGGILGTGAILIVQALAAFSVVSYFHIRKQHPETAHWFRTLLAPMLGGIGMIYVVYLLVDNAAFAAGSAATDPIFGVLPYLVGGVVVLGIVGALVLRIRSPQRYERIGRIELDT